MRPQARGGDSGDAGAGRWRWIAAGLFAGAVALHLWTQTAMHLPIVHADELGYYGNARWLVGEGNPPGLKYFPGYSVVLVPVAWLAGSDPSAYEWGLATNAVLAATGPVLALGLARRLGAPLRAQILAAGLVLLFPSYLLGANLLMAEVLLVPVVLAATWLTVEVVDGGRGRWAAVGLVGAAIAAAAVHPRGLAVPLAMAATAVACSTGSLGSRARRSWPVIVAAAGAAAVGAGAGLVVTARNRAFSPGDFGYGTDQLGPPGGLDELADILAAGGGQVVYLTLATLLIAPLAVVVGALAWRSLDRATRAALVMGAGSTAMAVAFGAAWLRDPERSDHVMYGRYAEAFAAPLLVLFVVLAAGRLPASRWWSALAIVGGGAPLVAVVLLRWSESIVGAPAAVSNVVALQPFFAAMDGLDPVGVIGVSVVMSALVVTIAAVGRPAIVALVALPVFAATATFAQLDFFVPGSDSRRAQSRTIDALERLEVQAEGLGDRYPCLAYDRLALSFWHRSSYLFHTDFPFVDWHSRRDVGAPPCELVVSQSDFDRFFPGALLVMGEDHVNQGLWAVGQTARRLATGSALWTPRTPASVAAFIDATIAVDAGGEVTVVNRSGSVVLPSPVVFAGQAPGPTAAVTVRMPDGTSVTVRLPRSLLPGETVAFQLARGASELVARGAEVALVVGDVEVATAP